MNILALDLSLRGAGIVVMPSTWNGDWSRISRRTYGEKLEKTATHKERVGRLIRISSEILADAEMFQPSVAVIEQYAFTARFGREYLAELGGVVRHQLSTRRGLTPEVVSPATARKFLMGACPRKGAKDAARVYLHRLGMPREWTGDEADAFVLANYVAGATEGAFAFAAEPVVKTNRKRAA